MSDCRIMSVLPAPGCVPWRVFIRLVLSTPQETTVLKAATAECMVWFAAKMLVRRTPLLHGAGPSSSTHRASFVSPYMVVDE